MIKRISILIITILIVHPNLIAQNPGKERLLFTLNAKNGFFKSNKELALLDGRINSYYPADGFNPDGYVSFSYYDNGDETDQHVRLSSAAVGIQPMRAEFDIETTCLTDSNFFFFCLLKDDGDYMPLGQPFVLAGATRQTLKVPYNTDAGGNAQVKMIATRKIASKCTFFLRNIKVYQIEK